MNGGIPPGFAIHPTKGLVYAPGSPLAGGTTIATFARKKRDAVSEEISHLIKDKGYPQPRAVAAALNQARSGKFGKGARRRAGRR